MTIAVRRATTEDAEVVSELNLHVQALHAAALPWYFKPAGPDAFAPEDAFAMLRQPDNVVLLAHLDGEPAGYVYASVTRQSETSLKFAYETVYLHHISVAPEFRRRGVGSALLEAVRVAGREMGISHLSADVWSFNDDARTFFRRHGLSPYVERLWSR